MISFKQSLGKGEVGEILFYEAHNGELERLDGRKSDFRVRETGAGLELKSDFYEMAKTQNFFFERYSDKDKQSPGGPFQAQKNGSNLFVYFYIKDLTFFIFKTDALVAYLEENESSLKSRDIPNSRYTTMGYLVPRESLHGLYEERKIKVYVE